MGITMPNGDFLHDDRFDDLTPREAEKLKREDKAEEDRLTEFWQDQWLISRGLMAFKQKDLDTADPGSILECENFNDFCSFMLDNVEEHHE